MYIIGKPKSDFELSNNSKRGMFNASNNSIERITNFCSCLFFMVLKNIQSLQANVEIV